MQFNLGDTELPSVEEITASTYLSTKHFCASRLHPAFIDWPSPDTFLQAFVVISILGWMDLGLDPAQHLLKPGK